MLYVSSINGDKIGVTDTDDGVTEYLTRRELLNAVKSSLFSVSGVDGNDIFVYNVNGGTLRHKVDDSSDALSHKVTASSVANSITWYVQSAVSEFDDGERFKSQFGTIHCENMKYLSTDVVLCATETGQTVKEVIDSEQSLKKVLKLYSPYGITVYTSANTHIRVCSFCDIDATSLLFLKCVSAVREISIQRSHPLFDIFSKLDAQFKCIDKAGTLFVKWDNNLGCESCSCTLLQALVFTGSACSYRDKLYLGSFKGVVGSELFLYEITLANQKDAKRLLAKSIVLTSSSSPVKIYADGHR